MDNRQMNQGWHPVEVKKLSNNCFAAVFRNENKN